MVKYREILRLTALGVSRRNVAFSTGCCTTTVQHVVDRAKQAGLSWPLPQEIDDLEIKRILYPPQVKSDADKAEINHEHIATQLKRRGVTMTLLWNEYCDLALTQGKEPYMYSAFCQRHRTWCKQTGMTMHVEHICADQIQIDWVGDAAKVCNPDTGELLRAYVFVATLPWSGYTYAEAFYRMDLESWITAHIHAFSFFGGVTPVLVPDNCRTAVTKHTREELVINDEYRRMAEYYGIAIVPARTYRPRDKAHVEMTVGVIERQVIAVLRDKTFFSLHDLNVAIKKGVEDLNERPFQKKDGSMQEAFLGQEKDLLIPLPNAPYEYLVRKRVTVNFNYHISFEGSWYSVPHQYIKREVEVVASKATITINCDGQRIAMHARSRVKGSYVTISEHMPDNHRDYSEWTGERFRKWAKEIGDATEQVIKSLLTSRKIEQQAYRSCRALLALSKKYGNELLEEACSKALLYSKRPSYKTVKSIIATIAADTPKDKNAHAYLRGADYYKSFE